MNHHVIKSDGAREEIKFDKITKRIKNQCKGLNVQYVIPTEVTRRVAESVVDGITTEEIDNLIANEAARLVTTHPDYSVLAARILVSRWQKNIPLSFSENVGLLYDNIDTDTGQHAPLVSNELRDLMCNEALARAVDRAIVHERDFDLDYFGLLTLKRGYLRHLGNHVAETPQFMWMRVALGIHGSDVQAAIRCYESMSKGLYTHATPTLFNAGTNRAQMSSCFLQAMKGDSIRGIFETFLDMAEISKNAGGIGVHIHNIRAKGTYIAGTAGTSNGIIPMLRVMNEEARYVDQCFDPITKIVTDKGNKQIADILPGEMVATSDGEFRKVVENKHYSEQRRRMVEINTAKGRISVTPDHLFLAVRNGRNIENLREKINNNIVSPEWIRAGSLERHDLIVNI
jgi:ribonucleoside-diphosphate reductase alpha chain